MVEHNRDANFRPSSVDTHVRVLVRGTLPFLRERAFPLTLVGGLLPDYPIYRSSIFVSELGHTGEVSEGASGSADTTADGMQRYLVPSI